MQLPLTQACSWSFLLLLASHLLLWENAASMPRVQLSTKDLYERLIIQSHHNHGLAILVYSEFAEKFMKLSWFWEKDPVPCHTASIPTPSSREEVLNRTTENILNVTISTFHAWRDAMRDLVPAVAALEGASDEYPGTEEGAYPAWTGQADLKSPNEDTRHFALFNMIRCLSRDTHRADNYLKVLRCREVFNNAC
ncbi:prolactin-3B1-like [Nannospalax galili]|uniref:prolactin-3B1-like n=1 Tax=Nannospalax galili TaxID=1026970 RepID=UPI000819E575|nr:prolactin-3B1-like [Nannospalax galili]